MWPYLVSLGIWNWFIAGTILLALEVLAPGTFMLWFGLAALLVGGISLVIDWSWQVQCIAFACLSVAFIPLWRRFAPRVEAAVDQPFLNRRSEAMVGQTFTLDKPIVQGVGAVRVGDTVWRVNGPDRPSGSRIRVTRADGAMLFVEPMES
jgi:membrane protein implicated in regulation of membrane protease activity